MGNTNFLQTCNPIFFIQYVNRSWPANIFRSSKKGGGKKSKIRMIMSGRREHTWNSSRCTINFYIIWRGSSTESKPIIHWRKKGEICNLFRHQTETIKLEKHSIESHRDFLSHFIRENVIPKGLELMLEPIIGNHNKELPGTQNQIPGTQN